jgi:hypothetical protein
MPGTELAFAGEVACMPTGFLAWKPRTISHRTAIFRQVNKDKQTAHHDALEFLDGGTVLLTLLCEGQAATVLQLPAQPATPAELNAQKRFSYVGYCGDAHVGRLGKRPIFLLPISSQTLGVGLKSSASGEFASDLEPSGNSAAIFDAASSNVAKILWTADLGLVTIGLHDGLARFYWVLLGYGDRHANRNSRNGSDGEYTTDHVAISPISWRTSKWQFTSQEVLLADLQATMTQNRISGGEMEIEVWKHEMVEVAVAFHMAFVGRAKRKRNLTVGCRVDWLQVERFDKGGCFCEAVF